MTQRLVTIFAGTIRNRTEMTTDASKIKVGMPATIMHPNDRYAAEIVSVSPSGHVVKVRSSCGLDAFTWRKRKDGIGIFAEAGKRSPILAIGFAETYLCPDL